MRRSRSVKSHEDGTATPFLPDRLIKFYCVSLAWATFQLDDLKIGNVNYMLCVYLHWALFFVSVRT